MSEEIRPLDELGEHLDPGETREIESFAMMLAAERPTPRAGFRAELRRRLGELSPQRPAWRPRRLRLLVASYVGSGLTLLAVAAIGLAGAGPLGY